MINKIVEFSLRERLLIFTLVIALIVGGLFAFKHLDIEAYPDPAPPTIEVIAQNPGWSAEEMERQVTLPLETQLNGMPGLSVIRSISLFGLTDIKCYFDFGTDYTVDRQEVLNRIQQASLPPGVQPQLSPESAIGEIYRYQLIGDQRYSLMDLKVIQDWTLERQFKQVPGVIDVVGFGGPTKEFHVDLDPRKLIQYGVSITQVMNAIANSNANVGANYLEVGHQSFNVRGIGLFKDEHDIENVMIVSKNGTPLYLKQLGRISVGEKVPLGRVGRDEDSNIVEGIVLMRPGEKSLPTLERVREKVAELNSRILPKGVKIVPYYDRTKLINITTSTVTHTLVTGMIFVSLIIIAFLGQLRASLIVALTIPLTLLFTFIIMTLRGDSANLISMGAIDFGIIVDASVVMVENICRHLAERAKSSLAKDMIITEAAREVGSAIFFSTSIIVAAFIPLFTMRGVEGKIFGPMAVTYGLALTGALVMAFFFAPAASSSLLKIEEEKETAIVRGIRRVYSTALNSALEHAELTLAFSIVILCGALVVLSSLGGEFMPKLEEGNLWVRATMPSTISFTYANQLVDKMRRVFKEEPEVTTVVSQLGRPDDGTDPTSYFNCEFFVDLKPRDQWRPGMTKEKLVSALETRLRELFPGVTYNFSQAIEDNVEEAMSGVKGENSIKLFGDNLEELDRLSRQIAMVMKSVPGITDLGILTELGQPNLLIRIDRERAARYGLLPSDINGVVQAAIGGQAVTQVLDGEKRFDVVVRFLPPYRNTVEAISEIPVSTPDGSFVPLRDVAEINEYTGASFIYREKNARYIPIKFSVRGRDLQSTIAEAESKISQQIHLPDGYRYEWAGEFQELQEALARLKVTVPVSLAIIFTLLYIHFHNLRNVLLVLSALPLALVGGVISLFVTGTNFSISAAVGFISLFGVAVLDGVILISYIEDLRRGGLALAEAVKKGAELRMRPVLMTALSAAIGLLPAATATRIGSETQRPLARVVVGGMVTAPMLILLVLPALYLLINRRSA
ncbi:efflux RND transporter permease subunit [Pyrinomonas methylaliphatogenes]|uniref:Heavy metal efflux pump, cobalt-zinc-cadmium n=1 Tax=Pyrinomonas methylaliphatogenes TaxID=454194 RepID=A0A0B6WX25_9BACT|nr:CusA/CzcA family heavy metal efflux RND transporter [Pyrinomonas methylaliphatogenes]CDM64849.1 heavy metal efflux pump, cobalt-zinc-cadmium [Pyrinomonas methylaliphatogenes]